MRDQPMLDVVVTRGMPMHLHGQTITLAATHDDGSATLVFENEDTGSEEGVAVSPGSDLRIGDDLWHVVRVLSDAVHLQPGR